MSGTAETTARLETREREFVLCAQSDLLDALRVLGATGPWLAVVARIPRDDAAVWDRMRPFDPHLSHGPQPAVTIPYRPGPICRQHARTRYIFVTPSGHLDRLGDRD